MSAPARRTACSTLLLLVAAAGVAAPAARGTVALADLPAVYATAAERARDQGFEAAFATLTPLLATDAAEADRARVVAGLLAHTDGLHRRAVELLSAGPGPRELEDWRLAALAASSQALGEREAARLAAEQLLVTTPESPLRAATLLRLAELAWEGHDAEGALARLADGRAEAARAGDDATRLALERLAWTIGKAGRLSAVALPAARWLLVEAPLEASKLQVAAALMDLPGGGDWRRLLAPDELLRRADRLLSIDLPQGALATLDATPPAARDLRWRLLRAATLVDLRHPGEALATLAPAVAQAGDERAELALARIAAIEAGRSPEAPARETVRAELAVAVASARAPEIATRALGALFTHDLAEDRLPDAIAVLRRLRFVAPDDSSGARPLWERGWRAFRASDFAAAETSWSALAELYPEHARARSARYWTARARLATGDSQSAARIFRDVASAPVPDFYARQARARLGDGAPDVALAPQRDAWPEDAAAERARLLSDLGLNGLALDELARLESRIAPRAWAATRALALARSGQRRESLRTLRLAFPALATADQARVPELALELYYPRDFDAAVRRAAAAERVPAWLVFGIVHQESAFDPSARSHSGARGLMQLMPSTGREIARQMRLPYSLQRLYDPEFSLRLGTAYFRQMLERFDGRVELALAGYNGGPGRIQRLWSQQGPGREIDLFLEDLALAEPRNYVKRILVLAESYRSLYSDLV